ncbi:hypothetical protein HDU82_008548 [Entophlyctis luteolus]|nr:hypothetical protein HDU82_008548 [Entophlyctis luteolus]
MSLRVISTKLAPKAIGKSRVRSPHALPFGAQRAVRIRKVWLPTDLSTPVCCRSVESAALAEYMNAGRSPAGQCPFDPVTTEIVGSEIQAQTAQSLANLKAVVEAGGSSFDHV